MPRPRSNKFRNDPQRNSAPGVNAHWFNLSVARGRRRRDIAFESRRRNRD